MYWLVTSAASAAAAIASTATAAASTTAASALLGLEAVTAEDRTVAARLKGYSGLLAAAGAGNSRAGSCARGVSAAAPAAVGAATAATEAAALIGLFGLATRFAALGR
jgi:hypothetical protein